MSPRSTGIIIGAGSGIGRATAIALAAAGYDLMLVSRTKNHLRRTVELAEEHADDGACLEYLPADITDPQACRQIVDHTLERFGRIDVIANIAGSAPMGPIADITPEQWRQTIDTNLSYVMYITAAAWPTFVSQKSGVIVNVSSLASVDPFPGFAMYAPAKLGVNMFTHITASEGKDIGLRAVAVAPGAVETDMLRINFPEKMLPHDKTLEPEDVAAVICGCITGKRAFESGETIMLPSP